MHLASHSAQSTGSKCLKMAPNASKWLQITPNGSKWLWLRQMAMAMVHPCPKWSQMISNGPKLSTMIQYFQKWSSMVPKCPRWSLRVKYGPKMFNMVLNSLQCSQLVLNGLKNDHKFNRMAFIARFNLVLVWSKIVQILTKESSKWVPHNQVSWSSLLILLIFWWIFDGKIVYITPHLWLQQNYVNYKFNKT